MRLEFERVLVMFKDHTFFVVLFVNHPLGVSIIIIEFVFLGRGLSVETGLL